MPLTNDTRQSIHDYLLAEITRFVKETKKKDGIIEEMPFHVRLLPALSSVRFSERSFSTRSGSWWQVIARYVGRQFHAQAVNGYTLTGQIRSLSKQHIESILDQMDARRERRRPNRAADIAEVCAAQTAGGENDKVVADLFILMHDHREMYFEIKTAKPNKDQSKATKLKILKIAAMRKGFEAEAYAATAYNQFGDGNPYTWNYAKQFLEIGEDMLIGSAFWSKIGDVHTYGELLEIAEDVGKKITSLLIEA